MFFSHYLAYWMKFLQNLKFLLFKSVAGGLFVCLFVCLFFAVHKKRSRKNTFYKVCSTDCGKTMWISPIQNFCDKQTSKQHECLWVKTKSRSVLSFYAFRRWTLEWNCKILNNKPPKWPHVVPNTGENPSTSFPGLFPFFNLAEAFFPPPQI